MYTLVRLFFFTSGVLAVAIVALVNTSGVDDFIAMQVAAYGSNFTGEVGSQKIQGAPRPEMGVAGLNILAAGYGLYLLRRRRRPN